MSACTLYARPMFTGPLILLFSVFIFSVQLFAEDSNPHGHLLRGEFQIGRSGRLILLPIKVDGATYSFLLDTGAIRSGFDSSMRPLLGEPRGTQVLQTFAGLKKVEVFDWPVATLGEQTLRTRTPVACVDFAELRRASNENIYGVIGMDVLRDNRILIDFDRGLLRFLERSPGSLSELGTKIPVELTHDGSPILSARITEDVAENLLVDTGAQGNSLRADLFDQLIDSDQIRLGSQFTSNTVAGQVSGNRGTLRQVTIGPFEQRDLRVSRLNISSIGLRYLSRFQIIFDFPAKSAYLKRSRDYSKPEPRATSGMTLNWVDGKITVTSIRKNGAAARAGLAPGDILVEIDGQPADTFDHFSLRQLLTSEGGKVISIQAERQNKTSRKDLVLDDD